MSKPSEHIVCPGYERVAPGPELGLPQTWTRPPSCVTFFGSPLNVDGDVGVDAGLGVDVENMQRQRQGTETETDTDTQTILIN